MIFLWVPETKQRTLEELDYICKSLELKRLRIMQANQPLVAVPTRKHMSYQFTDVIPYYFRRYILRRDVELKPLYKFQESYR